MVVNRYTQHREALKNAKGVAFKDLVRICTELFGEPRVKGSHHVFRMPWAGQPWVNLQKDGKSAKPYQVKQVLATIEKLENSEKS